MMTDELIQMIRNVNAGTGKDHVKIICGNAAFEMLLREATDGLGADMHFGYNHRDGYFDKFMGVPIEVNHNLDADMIYVFNEPGEEVYKPIKYSQLYTYDTAHNLIVDDMVDEFRDFMVKHNDAFATHYYGQWVYNNMASKHKEEDDEIDDNALMSVLNGGGFSAVV